MTVFYVNQLPYNSSEKPLTHFIHLQNIQSRISDEPDDFIKQLKNIFKILIGFLLLILLTTNIPTYIINVLYGPFYLNSTEFIQHVQNFKEGQQSWFFRFEKIQIELGEGNIQISENRSSVIKRYSNPIKKHRHISSFKILTDPKIFVKLPTVSEKYFSHKFEFDFEKFSFPTIKCILRNLLKTKSNKFSTKFNEKDDTFNFIRKEYSKSPEMFNKAVLTKCGILIGFLYRPGNEEAFISKDKYNFHTDDIAFDVTRPYSLTEIFALLILFCAIWFSAICYCLFYLLPYWFISCRIYVFERYGILASPILKINFGIQQQLLQLHLKNSAENQLLQLDQLRFESTLKYYKLSIIQISNGQQFVVILTTYLKEDDLSEKVPFVICAVRNIRRITFEGIHFVGDVECQDWPSIMDSSEREESAEWLHETLLEISVDYQLRFENAIQVWSLTNAEFNVEDPFELRDLINEEKNIQYFKILRLSFFTFFNFDYRNNTRLTACFRFLEDQNPNFVDDAMIFENCVICVENFEISERFSTWPCDSLVPHRFHYSCMLKWIRTKNCCPLCQQEAIFNV